MKLLKKTLVLFTAFIMLLSLAACKVPSGDVPTPSVTPDTEPAASAEVPEATDTATPDTSPEVTDDVSVSDMIDFSAGLDENGYWDGVNASEHIGTFEYTGIEIPFATHNVSDEALQAEIDYILDSFKTSVQVTDRAVVDGDTVNIDYVGSVDGVEFVGGSTGGNGVEVIIGVSSYIDDFLAQVIGHMPGDEFDINVTFPEGYNSEELSGKAAVFKTKVNFIVEGVRPELTDEFVATNLAMYGWTTVEQLKLAVTDALSSTAVTEYIYKHILSALTISSIPGQVLKRQEDLIINEYKNLAAQYNMELEPFIISLLGLESIEALLEYSAEVTKNKAAYQLAVQSIAVDLGIVVTDAQLQNYFMEVTGSPDYSMYELTYGRPYLAQGVLGEMVAKHLTDTAVYLPE